MFGAFVRALWRSAAEVALILAQLFHSVIWAERFDQGIRRDRAKLPPHGRFPCHLRNAFR
jgi:hypothetical protein